MSTDLTEEIVDLPPPTDQQDRSDDAREPVEPVKVHRLRDLSRSGRLVALALLIALMAPYVAAVARAAGDHWVPSNDDALLALRVEQVLNGEFPLVGQPSTAAHYSDLSEEPARHPGPIQFYLFAPIVAVFGFDLGMLIGPAVLNFSAIAVAAWVIFRRAGPLVGVLGAVLLGLVAYAQGPVQLADPLSSNQGGIALVALGVLGWAVHDRDLKLLPLAAFYFAWVGQQHLAILGVAGGLAAWIALGVAVLGYLAWRHRDRAFARDLAIWGGVAVAVSFLAWLPVIIDQFFDTGNVTNFIHYAQDNQRPTVGLGSGVRQSTRMFTIPPKLVQTDLYGGQFWNKLSTAEIVTAMVTVAALAAITIGDLKKRNWQRPVLVAMVFALGAIGAYSGSNVPWSIEANRINFYRWVVAGNVLVWLMILWFLADAVADFWRRREWRSPLSNPLPMQVLSVATVAAIALVSVTAGLPREDSDKRLFPYERRFRAEVQNAVDNKDKVLLTYRGPMAAMSLMPTIALHLVDNGHEIVVPAQDRDGYGEDRVAGDDYDVVVVIESSDKPFEPAPGKVVTEVGFNDTPALRRAEASKKRQAKVLSSQPLEYDYSVADKITWLPADQRREMLTYTRYVLENDPGVALSVEPLIKVLELGFIKNVVVDTTDLQAFVKHQRMTIWGQDWVRIRTLTPKQFRGE